MASLRRLRTRVLRRADSGTVLLAVAVAVGVLTGGLAAALIAVIELVQRLAWGESASTWEIVAVPTLGAVATGLVIRYAAPEVGGSGIVATLTSLALRGGRLRVRVPPAGLAATGLAIGTGASGGREGPIVLIGGAVGSLLGRALAFDEDRMRALVAAGAAAGIGASFNAPIGGTLFAIELLLGGVRAGSLQVVVVAAVAGSVTARELIGPEIIYRPEVLYRLGEPVELVLYALLALAAVATALALTYGEDAAKRAFARLRVPLPVRLGIGGLGVGLLALAVPEVLGTGDALPPINGFRDPVQRFLDGGYGTGVAAAGLLLALAAAKLLATCLSIGSGSAVGTFAPTVFIGAALGAGFGALADVALPGIAVQPGAYALVGFAATFSAAARAPLTSILIAFELTGDYGMVLPLMLACGLATYVADRLSPDSLYTLPLRRKGIVTTEPQDVDVLQTVTVGEVMTAVPETLDASTSLDQVRERFARTTANGFPVVRPGLDGPRLVGVLTRGDLDRAGSDAGSRTAGDIATTRPLTVTPRDPVFRAVRRMAQLDVGRLPVVADDDHGRLVGWLRRHDVVTAYQRAITRSLGAQHRRDARLRDLAGTTFVELAVGASSGVAGRAVREIPWPPRTIVAQVRRGAGVLVPGGDTTIEVGDELVLLTADESAEAVRDLVTGDSETS